MWNACIRNIKKNAEQREEASQKLIEQFKQERDKLKRSKKNDGNEPKTQELEMHKILTLQTKVSDAEMAAKKAEEKCSSLERINEFYQMLSSVKVVLVEDHKFECEVFHNKEPKKSTHFEINVFGKEIEYAPLSRSANDLLPQYMKETICFENSELPCFLEKLLLAFYKK